MRKTIKSLVALSVLCLSMGAQAQVGNWRDMYKVKKKDTIFGIAKKYGLTVPELMDANPEMKKAGYELKKGDFIFIPYAKATVDTSSTKKSVKAVTPSSTIHIGVMLPLHNVDGDGRRMIEYYRGMLMACDSLRREGISTDIHAWNVDIDANISQFTKDPAAAKCDIIFGPLYTTQVQALAEFCKARNIKMVIPFSINGDDVSRYQQIFQVYQSADKLNNEAIEAFIKRFKGWHTVIIDCNDKDSKKGIFTFGLRNRLTNEGRKFSITNLNSSEEFFAKAFSTTQPNVVILNTGRAPELTVAIAKIQSYRANHPKSRIALFGYTEWLMYTRQHLDDFFQLDTYVPSTFYYNALDRRTQQFEQSYRRWFHSEMQYAFPRFALTGYDQTQFFVRGLRKYGKGFKGLRSQSTYHPMQTPLQFKQVSTAGMQNENFQLIHYLPNQTIESITY
ncbi:MAG: LysM peptidoglycan-binding domain-containing protein [Prevotella sp.]